MISRPPPILPRLSRRRGNKAGGPSKPACSSAWWSSSWIIWSKKEKWNSFDGHYHRSKEGGGSWEFKKKLPEYWTVNYNDLTFKDEFDYNTAHKDRYNMLKLIFKDGKMIREQSLKEIRDRLNGGKF